MPMRDPTSNAHIEELISLAGSFLTRANFLVGLDDDQEAALLAFYDSIAQRFGAKAASRACSRLGGVAALQQLLKGMHKRKLQASKHNRLMADIDDMLARTDELDRIRDEWDHHKNHPSDY